MSVLDKIEVIGIIPNQYKREYTDKNQVVLHHTVSGRGVKGDVHWWLSDNKRIATSLIIHHDGTPFQLFSTNYWAYHLGIKSKSLQVRGFTDYRGRGRFLEAHSIGIELDSWGPLVEHEGRYYPASKPGVPRLNCRPVPCTRVQHYPDGFRGYHAYEKYTKEQIQTLKELLEYFNVKWNIPLTYNEDMWDVSNRALNCEPGIWAHVSYRSNKSDIHPDPQLIEMIKSLE